MAQPVYRAPANFIPELHDPVLQLRRTVIQDVKRFGEQLTASPLQDGLTGTLRVWQKNFASALEIRNADFAQVLPSFLDSLEKSLVVPVLNYPLDEECMLGSDGHTYGKSFLRLHSHRSVPPFNQRSPLKPDDPTPFTAVPHDIARNLVKWLKKYRSHFRSEELEKEAAQIPENAGQAFADPPQVQMPPNNLRDRVQRIRQQQAERRQETEQRERIRLQERQIVEGMMDQIIDNNVAQLQQHAASQHTAAMQRLDAIEQPLTLLQQHAQQLQQDIQVLQNDIHDLRTQQSYVDVQIEGAKADNIQLQIAIKETEQAIKERDKGGFGEVFTALIAIAACAVGSWAIQAALQSLGASSVSVTFSPMSNGAKAQLILKGF